MTLQELHQLDAGIFMGEQFRGTKVPLLEELLTFAKEKRLHIKLDNKFERFTRSHKLVFFEIVKAFGGDVGFTCAKPESIAQVVELFSDGTIHYDGSVDEETLKAVKALLKNNPLVLWLPLLSPLTDWVKVPLATPELCRMVKSYGKLGLWILETKKQLACACVLGADIVETTSSLKP